MHTTSLVSFRNIYVRYFAKDAVLFAGWRFQGSRPTSQLPTNLCWSCFPTIEFFGAGLIWHENESSFKDCPRAFVGWDMENEHNSVWPSTTWSRKVKSRPRW